MTCREKLKIEHPEYVDTSYRGGCKGCPSNYGYLPDPPAIKGYFDDCTITCTVCWDREIPVEDLKKIEDEAVARMKKECFSGDIETDHGRADSILIGVLNKIGLCHLVETYNSVDKWYA